MGSTKFDIEQKAQEILGLMVFDNVNPKIFVNWAVDALLSGYETESLLILAGLDGSDKEESLNYFRYSLNELNIQLKEEKFEVLHSLAIYTAKAVINEKIIPAVGLSKMMFICGESNYDEKYDNFFLISEDIDLINYGLKPRYIKDLNNNNFSSKLLFEFVKFLEENDIIQYRKSLENKSDNQLIEIKFFEKMNYSNASLLIVEAILNQRGLNETRQFEMKDSIQRIRNEKNRRNKNLKKEKRGILRWLFEIFTS